MTPRLPAALALLCLLIPAASSLAHVPEHPDQPGPISIQDPTTSRVFYHTFTDPSQQRTYTFTLETSDRLVLGLNRPVHHEAMPTWSLQGPNGTIPLPEPTPPPRAGYEPFAPSALESLATLDRAAPANGTYTLTLSATPTPGTVAFVIGGNEAFTPTEWVRTPIDVLRTHAWEGQPWPVILAPALLTLLAGTTLLATGRPFHPQTPPQRLACAGALLALATALTTLVQLLWAAQSTGPALGMLITGTLIALQLGVAYALAVWANNRGDGLDRAGRAWGMVWGLAGLLVWAGWILGPFLALAAALWPGDQTA